MPIFYKDGLKFDTDTGNNKKYKVYLPNGHVVYFGDKRYQQYHDSIGGYIHMDHLDPYRRQRYRERHKNDKGVKLDSPEYPGFWSWYYLW